MESTQTSKLIIIVLYKIPLLESHTIQALVNCKKNFGSIDKIEVWDNSPFPQKQVDIERLKTFISCPVAYNNTPENISLAKIYNTVINKNSGYDFVIFLDQDSVFYEDYFTKLEIAEKANPDINLFAPLIRNKNLIVSPGYFHYFKGSYWKKEKYGVVAAKNNVAIMSGLVARTSYLQRFGLFEERLQLYGIDTNFMLRYARDNKYFFVLDIIFEHDLSEFKDETRGVKLRRFQQFKLSSLINSELFSPPIQLLTRIFLTYRSIMTRLKLSKK